MKKQRTLLITMLAFLVILIGAYILYTHLADSYKPESMLAVPGNTADSTQPSQEQTDSAATETVQPDETAAGSAEDTSEAEEQQLQAAPDFAAYDRDGNAVKLSDFIGKPIVLNFWASWCGPCKSEMPEFDAAYKELGSEVQFMIVNLTDGSRETVDVASAYIEKEGYTFPVFYDTDIDAAMKYGVSSIPATYFIDKDGYLIAYGIGALNGETLSKGIGMITSAEE